MTLAERETLDTLERSRTAPHQQVLRAKALLTAADGVANTRIVEDVGVTPVTVRAWRQRFSEDGLAGLEKIREGRGRKPSIPEWRIAADRAVDHYDDSGRRHALAVPHDGQAGRGQFSYSATHLVGSRVAAASDRYVQGVQRCVV